GVAFQNTNIYAMSYKENLELYDSLSKEKMTDLTELLGLEAVLEKNNADFESELTREFHKNGIMLSGGEAQKIALARVMAHHFGLLLLDEPSSALDPIAEYKMSEIILDAANKSTTIIVAHRLSMVKNVDKIIVMDNGSILEIGTHEELMAAKGKYYEMFTKQAENYAV
ncbi:MAG: ATP-binding cassette domain-containing protein, partial [Clostridia bacterium]|nr:ATP-binding cassette domain-containing protein [Clostridia bacterium]